MSAKKPPIPKRSPSRLKAQAEALAHLRTVIDSAPVIITAIDSNGTMTLTAGQGLTAAGRKEGVFVGQSIFDVCKDSPDVCVAIRRALRGEEFVSTVSFDGRWFESHYCPLRSSEGEIIGALSVASDITERVKTEEARRRNEDLNSRTLEAVAGGIVHVDLNGRIVRANPEAQRILGLSYDQISQMFVSDWRHTTLREDGTEFPVEEYPVSMCLKTGQTQGPSLLGLRRPDGKVVWGLYTAVPLRDEKGLSGAVVTMYDVTERRELESRYQQMFQQNPQAIYVYDQHTLQILDANNAALKQYGYTREEFLKLTIKDLRPPGEVPKLMQAIRGEKPGLNHAGTWIHRKRNGELMDIEVSFIPIDYRGREARLALAYNVTQRVRAERALAASEERYRAFVRNSTEAIWCYEMCEPLDTSLSEDEQVRRIFHESMLIECNEAMARRHGYSSSAEMIGKPLNTFMPYSDARNVDAVRAAVRSGFSLENQESYELDRNGNLRCFLNNLVGIIENGRVIRTWGTKRDITELKAAEEALKESERSSRELIDSTFDAIVIHDKGRILEINQGCTRLFGYERDEIIGKHVLDFAPPEAHALIAEKMAKAADKPYEATGLRKDGTQFSVEAVGRPYNFKGKPVRVAALRDITARKAAEAERRRAEQALGLQRADYQMLFNSVQAMIWYKDTENRILRVNKAAAEAMGMSIEQIEGRSTYDIYPQEAGKYHEDDKEVIRSQRPKLGIIETLTTPTGTRRWVQTDKYPCFDEHGKVIGVVVLAVDITDKRRAEEAARESDERLRSIFNSAQDVMFLVDRQHRYLTINESVRRYGLEPAALIGRTVFDVQPAEVAKHYAGLHDKVFSTGKPVQAENHFRATQLPGQPERWHSLTLSPVCDAHGNVVAVTGISRDITELKIAERERVALERKLLEAQKLESMGVLAGGIAHDFNNLLAAILGNVSLANMQVPPDSPLRTNLQSIETTTHRAAELCKQMLSYAGRSRIDVHRVDVNAIISEMSELLKISIGRTILLKFNLAKSIPQIVADGTQLRQVVMNLILNASEAIGDKEGAISLSTSLVNLTRADLIDTFSAPDLAPGEYLSIQISDNGCGMDEATRQRIFDPFFTTKFSGRGLGLAAVMGIVRGHHGAIRVESAVGHGTTFTVLLPISVPQKEKHPA